ncbi:nuclear transport factor 2 family protein [Nocardioides sp. GY 10127]|uniref:nuclear transport factor 2 family protein n=1 Tax=Nocardioides sp. GY 10127 TaxID=2569762 RepID=UPI0010A78B00|nr:nuclear transport factor 2 family protein [Nocardioides sp. GY 10127]TIC81747.1 hypothetical protein E8D37_11210 [Nocardioides sp. GY 10127]
MPAAGVGPAALRHAAENLLVGYLRAVDEADLDGVLAVLGDARVDFAGEALTGAERIGEAYRTAFAASGPTCHLLHPGEVHLTAAGGPGSVAFRFLAPYQRWSLAGEAPVLTTLGRYHVELTWADGAARVDSLRVERHWPRG